MAPAPAAQSTAPAPAKPPAPVRVRATKGETCSRCIRYCVDWCGANMSGVTGCPDGCRARGETCNATGEWTVKEGVMTLTHMAPR
ncbi:MAG: hypothetical protein IPK81_20660 [Rhodospirillales bacterium]|nr:MAG: hypothetical protein IPK81_20660 [Rhodospirillales bacterium]